MNPLRRIASVVSASSSPHSRPLPLLSGMLLLSLLFAAAPALATADRQSWPTEAPADLLPVESSEFDILYIKPGFEPGDYGKLIIDEPEIVLDEYWKWTNRRDITERDLKRIETSTAKILREQFGSKLSAGDGYSLAQAGEAQGEGVLRLKPAMLDLNLNAPDLSVPERRKTYIRSAGHATLYLDLYDGASGELLLRVIDHDRARDKLRLYEGNRATNYRDFSIMAGRWANALRRHLDVLNGGTA